MNYEQLLKDFDGSIDSIPTSVQNIIIDRHAESGSIEALEAQYDIPAEMIRVVLAQPDLMQKALARRKGEFALRFVNEVLPAAMSKAASGETGSIQAAKLVASVIGAVEGRSSRPTKKQTEGAGTLEEKLTAITQVTPNSERKPAPRLTSRKKK